MVSIATYRRKRSRCFKTRHPTNVSCQVIAHYTTIDAFVMCNIVSATPSDISLLTSTRDSLRLLIEWKTDGDARRVRIHRMWQQL
jgi:hypothetical protein